MIDQNKSDRLLRDTILTFKQQFPEADADRFTTDLANIMMLFGLVSAPMATVEFREALRSFANLLEIVREDLK